MRAVLIPTWRVDKPVSTVGDSAGSDTAPMSVVCPALCACVVSPTWPGIVGPTIVRNICPTRYTPSRMPLSNTSLRIHRPVLAVEVSALRCKLGIISIVHARCSCYTLATLNAILLQAQCKQGLAFNNTHCTRVSLHCCFMLLQDPSTVGVACGVLVGHVGAALPRDSAATSW